MKKHILPGYTVSVLLLATALLAGCGAADDSTPPSGASSAPVVASQPVPSEAPPAASAAPESGAAVPALPTGTLAPVTDATALDGIWFHFPEGDRETLGNADVPVYQYRFDAASGAVAVSYGIFETDANDYFYGGAFTLGEDGLVTITLPDGGPEVEGPAPDYPAEALTLAVKAEQAAENPGVTVFTLVACEGADPDFASRLGAAIGTPMAYKKF